jgi:glycosyltransferase involved in cell wall biosynthesis
MKKILFISKGINSSSTRYRASQYFDLFINNGFIPKHASPTGDILNLLRTLNEARKSDVVILVRKTFPFPIFWLLRKLSKVLIFDFDDAIFCNSDGSSSKTRMHRFIKTVKNCNHIFAGNAYLAETASKFNPNVTLVPTSVDTKKYHVKINKRIDGILKLVWIGSSSTKKYIEEIIPYLETANKILEDIQLNIVADFSINSDVINIKNIAWSEEVEINELITADIGIAPMPENNWTKGKCALKVIQYMAAGLPVISTTSGVNGRIVENNITGYISDNYNKWPDLIQKLNFNKQNLNQMGNAGRYIVSTEFDINLVFLKILLVIKKLN